MQLEATAKIIILRKATKSMAHVTNYSYVHHVFPGSIGEDST